MKPKMHVEALPASYLTTRSIGDALVLRNQVVTSERWREAVTRFGLLAVALATNEPIGGGPRVADARIASPDSLVRISLRDDHMSMAQALARVQAMLATALKIATHSSIAVAKAADHRATWSFDRMPNSTSVSRIELVCRVKGCQPDIVLPSGRPLDAFCEDSQGMSQSNGLPTDSFKTVGSIRNRHHPNHQARSSIAANTRLARWLASRSPLGVSPSAHTSRRKIWRVRKPRYGEHSGQVAA